MNNDRKDMKFEKNIPRFLGAAFLLVIVTSLIAGTSFDSVVGKKRFLQNFFSLSTGEKYDQVLPSGFSTHRYKSHKIINPNKRILTHIYCSPNL